MWFVCILKLMYMYLYIYIYVCVYKCLYIYTHMCIYIIQHGKPNKKPIIWEWCAQGNLWSILGDGLLLGLPHGDCMLQWDFNGDLMGFNEI